MRIPESDQESTHSVSLDSAAEAGPSSLGLDAPVSSNGHTNGNGFTLSPTNGFTNGGGAVVGNGVQKHGKSVAKVSLPGTALYTGGSYVDREEFVRLVVQTLRDVGYMYVEPFYLPRHVSQCLPPTESPQLPLKQSLVIPWKHRKYRNFDNTSWRHRGVMPKMH